MTGGYCWVADKTGWAPGMKHKLLSGHASRSEMRPATPANRSKASRFAAADYRARPSPELWALAAGRAEVAIDLPAT